MNHKEWLPRAKGGNTNTQGSKRQACSTRLHSLGFALVSSVLGRIEAGGCRYKRSNALEVESKDGRRYLNIIRGCAKWDSKAMTENQGVTVALHLPS